MVSKKSKFKIDESILLNSNITPEQNLLECVLFGESRELALKKAENIIKCIADESNNPSNFMSRLNESIKDNPIGPLTLFAILTKHTENEFSYRAKLIASIGLDNDPKQNEKKIVKECWDAWQIKPEQYRSKTNFATAMIDKFRPDDPADEDKHLTSVKKITVWCTLWQREK